jgi:hypothetical protein
MTILITQEERNNKAAAISESHVRTISELGFTVAHERDANGCFGKVALDAPRRDYTLTDGTKIRGPILGDLPEAELREHFAAELKRANLVVEPGVLAKKALAAVLTGVLWAGFAIPVSEGHQVAVHAITAAAPIAIPVQPHTHSETAGTVLLVGQAAEGMFTNVTATATTTTYTLPKL